jgi:hypothetical protein
MFLKRFKEKSNQKYKETLLVTRELSITNEKVTSIGIILSENEFNDHESLRLFFKSIGIHDNKIKVVTFVENKQTTDRSWEVHFSTKEFGWKGKIDNADLQNFIDKPFDMLLGYYLKPNLELDLVTAASKAKFKIGISGHDERLFDLIIQTSTYEVFKKELVKYLTQLKKL